MITPYKVKPASVEDKTVALSLCLHPTIGDSQRARMVPAKYLWNMLLVLGLVGPLVGSHRGIHSHHGCAERLTHICLELVEVTRERQREMEQLNNSESEL